MIEGNKGPDLDIIQRTARAPIGNSRLGVLLAHHFRRALGDEPLSQCSMRDDMDLHPRPIREREPHMTAPTISPLKVSPLVTMDSRADLGAADTRATGPPRCTRTRPDRPLPKARVRADRL